MKVETYLFGAVEVSGCGRRLSLGLCLSYGAVARASRWGRTAKLVIVVGPDVDPYDLKQVEWAIMTRWQPVKDSVINPSGVPMVLDPSCEKSAQFGAFRSQQMGIDATIKVPERFTEYPEVSAADFLIEGPGEHGIPGLVNLFGIESPGLTASWPIAQAVARRLGLVAVNDDFV